jgi:phage/plasmid-like protein (TIGR03299 family)
MSAQVRPRSIMGINYGITAEDLAGDLNFDQLREDPALNWKVEKRPLTDNYGNPAGRLMGLFREDNDKFLGSVSARYEVLQNSKLLTLFQPLFDQGILELDCAGTFRKDSRIFVIGRSLKARPIEPVKGDEQLPYHMLYAGHDGGTAFRSVPFSCRLMCTNMMPGIFANARRAGTEIRFVHRQGVNQYLDSLQQMILSSTETLQGVERALKLLAGVPVRNPAKEYRKLLNLPTLADRANYGTDEEFEQAMDAGKHKVRWLMDSYSQEAETTPTAALDSAYHWLNGVTRHVTHDMPLKNGNSRIQRAVVGTGSSLSNRAMQHALTIAA